MRLIATRPRRTRPGAGLPRPFWVVWTAATVSFLGDGIYSGAVPLLATSITTDPGQVALTTVLSRSGWITVGLISGVLVDRWSKTRVMWRVDAARGLVVAVFAALTLMGHHSMAVLYGVSLLLGLGAPLFDTASSAVLPRLVGTVALDRANSWNQTSLLLGATLIGPPLGAALFLLSPGVPLAAQAASFLVAAALVATLGCIRTGPTATPAERSLRRELVDGLRYLVGHRLLRTLALLLAAINAATGCVLALLVLYVLRVLRCPAAAYGCLVAVFAVGGLVGAVVVPTLRATLGTSTAILLAASLFAGGTLLMALLPQQPFVIVGIIASGVGSSLWNVITMALRQRVVPADLQGRVTASYRMVGLGALPIGAAAGGLLATQTSVQSAYLIAGLALMVATVVAARPLRASLAAR